MDRGGSEERGGALPLPQRRRPQLAPGRLGSRWVIDFNAPTGRRSQEISACHTSALLERVKPERARKAEGCTRERHGGSSCEPRPAMRKAIAELDEMLVLARVSKTVMPVRVHTGQVLSESSSFSRQTRSQIRPCCRRACIRCGRSSTAPAMRTDPLHALGRIRDFPAPSSRPSGCARSAGLSTRSGGRSCCGGELGLTKLYNLVNDPDIADSADADVARMREIHVELDQAVMDAYGWGDVPLDHGFHTYRQMRRWTVSPAARVEILDRLLAENLRRAEAQGEAPPPADDEEEGDERMTTPRTPVEPPSYRLEHEPDGRSWTVRENLADILERELLGPANGPEEVIDGSPDSVYLIGRIAPVKLTAGTDDPVDADTGEPDTDVGDAAGCRVGPGRSADRG